MSGMKIRSLLVLFYLALAIRPKEASDSDFTIEDVMLWPGMRLSLRSQCKRCSAGRLQLMAGSIRRVSSAAP